MTGQTILYHTDSMLDLKFMELEIQKWTEKSREAYQAQYGCLMRLRHEVIALRAMVSYGYCYSIWLHPIPN